jgi:hypothetical protein
VLEPDFIQIYTDRFSGAGITFLVSGSVAATFYGEPRVTHDIDLIVVLAAADILRMGLVFPASEYYVPPVEVLTTEARRESRGHFNLIHHQSGLKADCYVASRDPLHAWAFANKRGYEVEGRTIPLAPPEYVIVRKLEFYREGGSEKHLRDIATMLAVSGGKLNNEVLHDWISRRQLQEEWRKVTGS